MVGSCEAFETAAAVGKWNFSSKLIMIPKSFSSSNMVKCVMLSLYFVQGFLSLCEPPYTWLRWTAAAILKIIVLEHSDHSADHHSPQSDGCASGELGVICKHLHVATSSAYHWWILWRALDPALEPWGILLETVPTPGFSPPGQQSSLAGIN